MRGRGERRGAGAGTESSRGAREPGAPRARRVERTRASTVAAERPGTKSGGVRAPGGPDTSDRHVASRAAGGSPAIHPRGHPRSRDTSCPGGAGDDEHRREDRQPARRIVNPLESGVRAQAEWPRNDTNETWGCPGVTVMARCRYGAAGPRLWNRDSPSIGCPKRPVNPLRSDGGAGRPRERLAEQHDAVISGTISSMWCVIARASSARPGPAFLKACRATSRAPSWVSRMIARGAVANARGAARGGLPADISRAYRPRCMRRRSSAPAVRPALRRHSP